MDRSYKDKITHWKHGGIVGVLGYGSGIIGRYSDLPDEFPGVEHFHTIRVNSPPPGFTPPRPCGTCAPSGTEHGSSVLNVHGSTGDMVFLGTTTDELEPTFAALTAKGWDLGGSGSAMRTPSCCVGEARCE